MTLVRNNLEEYIACNLDQLQVIENELQKFKNVRNIDDATGVVLDSIGEIVGEDRNGREDNEYRIAIKYRIVLNYSNGEPESLIQAVRIFTEATNIHYTHVYPAGVNIVFTSSIAPPANLRELLEDIAPAGVKIFLGWVNSGPYFGFAGEGGLPALPDSDGFGESGTGNEDIGGYFVEEI